MRIGINGRFLVAKQTGVQRAAYNLVSAIVHADRENEYFLFTCETKRHRVAWNFPNFHVITSNLSSQSIVKNTLWEQFQLPRLAAKYKIDILHSPANMAPLFYRGKSIIHIHDLCFIVNPQWYSFFFRNWYNFIIPRLARRATKIITNSNHSRNDLIQFCQLEAEHISLVYWAVDEQFFCTNPIPSEERKDFILYVGSLEPRKNIDNLVLAYQNFRHQHPECRTKLVLIGGESRLFAQTKLRISDYTDDIILKGFVSEEDLRKYYREATLVAYPSLYEGFGLPPLEAMASGTPVVTSLTSSLPEVVGTAAIKINPHDAEQIAESIATVVTDQALQRRLTALGLEHVRIFNWNKVARNILSIYHRVHHNNDIPYSQWRIIATQSQS